jgi:NAD(P)-dependent dehydrogenase (short-subunit alcohol dehydrogenase family)
MTGDLSGKVAVVTGSSPNIGAGIALGLGAAGASVACLDIRQQVAELCAEELRAKGSTALGLQCDVTDEQDVSAAFTKVTAELGQIDILVNGAVVFNEKGISDMTVAEWRKQIDIILTGAFIGTKVAVAMMRSAATQGSIINLISTAGHQGEPGNVAYSTAKSGLLNFTRAVAMDVARWGIRVNSLTPTSTDPAEGAERASRWGLDVGHGPLSSPEKAREFRDRVAKKAPMMALPSPSDYGSAAAFLASESARFITGCDLRVDAGTVAKYWRWDPGDDTK